MTFKIIIIKVNKLTIHNKGQWFHGNIKISPLSILCWHWFSAVYSLLEISSADYEIKIFKLILGYLLGEKCTSDFDFTGYSAS